MPVYSLGGSERVSCAQSSSPILNCMSTDAKAVAEAGLLAWRDGDFETLARLLDPAVEWHWFEPGGWDCHGRDDVLRTLRDRHAQGFAAGALKFRDAGENTVIVVSHPREIGGPEWPAETATVMRFRDGRVISMQDYRTEHDALAAVAHN
jgi:ketosteroid isomerase-like protein